MYEYLVSNPIIGIIFLVIVVLLAVLLLVKWIQYMGMEKVRGIVYEGFVHAENNFLHGENSQKFDYVVQLARSYLPAPFNLFISEKMMREVIQLWFDLVKDILDDGRMNGTGSSKED